MLAAGWPQPWLVVSEQQPDGTFERRWAFPGRDGACFAVRWQHSVEHEDWIETFVLDDGRTYVIESRFKTFGAGVPDGGVRSRLDQGWVVSDFHRQVDPLLVQAAIREHYRLRYGGRYFDMGVLGQAPVLRFQQQELAPVAVMGALWRPWQHRVNEPGAKILGKERKDGKGAE